MRIGSVVDEVIFGDLIADYATKVDLQVLSGANSAGEVKGLCQRYGDQPRDVHGHDPDGRRVLREARFVRFS